MNVAEQIHTPTRRGIFVAGAWAPAQSADYHVVRNPATLEPLAEVADCSAADVAAAVDAARESFRARVWRDKPIDERAGILRRVSQLILENADELARIETLEQGRSIRQSRHMMVPLAAQAWDFFASALTCLHSEAVSPGRHAFGYVLHQPIGVVGLITPWNVPLVLASEKMAPALAMGNSIILKPPPETSLASMRLVELVAEAGIPAGVVNLITGAATAGNALVCHPDVGMVAFTGSTATGKKIAQAAAGALKKLLLELGGKAPLVVFDDADLEAAVNGTLWGGFLNSGQICMAATRLLVHESVFQPFLERLIEKTDRLRLGPGIDPSTDLGPVVSATLKERILSFIVAGQEEGADLCYRRQAVPEVGHFVPPAIFANPEPQSTIYREEIFGPVLCANRFDDMQQAVQMANDTPYGLAASVWTRDIAKALTLAEEIQAGFVWVNDHTIRTPGLPFGGFKQSGIGRENALSTLLEYSQAKSVYIDRTESAYKPRYRALFPSDPIP